MSIYSTDEALEYSQLDDIKGISNVSNVAPYKAISSTVSRNSTVAQKASIIATNESYMDIMNLTISDGRLISGIDLDNNSKVCLIGIDMATTLFDEENPVGEKIKIDGDNYSVIGVITEVGSSMGNDVDSTIIIPFTTSKYLQSDTSISSLYIKVEYENKIESTIAQVENYIETSLGITTDYFSVSSQDSMLDTVDSVNNSLSILLGGIASISLIVAGIGVMNVMLVSVTERTKEIGIRKALGATRKDILIQFLIESLILCIIGGILGIVLGIFIGNLLDEMGYSFTASVSIVLIAFLSSVMIGVVFGIFPAYKASKLNPIDALHTD